MNKIPKKIHFCWFGESQFNLTIKRCIASWKYHLPDYEIVLWNESNFDIESNSFIKSAYRHKKYAFVSDYVRMFALYNQGGVYLDTDVEVFRSFEPLLKYDFFIGLEDIGRFGTSTIGCSAGHWLPEQMLTKYHSLSFDHKNLKKMVNVNIVSNILMKYGFDSKNHEETINNQKKLPIGSFGTAKKNSLPKTVYAKHLFDGSWNKGSKSNLSKGFKYLARGGLLSDINSLIKIIKYH